MTVVNIKKKNRSVRSSGISQMDDITAKLIASIEVNKYKAKKKIPALRWCSIIKHLPSAIVAMVPFSIRMLKSILFSRSSYQNYKVNIDKVIDHLRKTNYDDLTLRGLITKLDKDLTPIIGKIAGPPMTVYIMYMMKYMNGLDQLFEGADKENKHLIESLTAGFADNEAANIGIQIYRMVKLLSSEDFIDIKKLADQTSNRELSNDFMQLWDAFILEFGSRGPSELELSNPRYGDDPCLALEQMSYMVDSEYNPEAIQENKIADRQLAYTELARKLKGSKLRKFRRVYNMLDLYGPARDTPKYLWVLNNGIVKKRALKEGKKFVDSGRLDKPDDIFWMTLNEIDQANIDPSFDLRKACEIKQPFYHRLNQVVTFPHIIDSRGRVGQVKVKEITPGFLWTRHF